MKDFVIAVMAFLNGIGNSAVRLATLGWGMVLFLAWFVGMVWASGFWSTVVAIFFFPYAWYVVVERLMATAGLL